MATVNTTKVSPLLQRGLKKVIFDEYMLVDQKLKGLFHMNTADGAWEEWAAVAGIGPAEVKPEGTAVQFKSIETLTPKRVYMTKYALGMRATMEAKQDERYGILGRLAKEIGRKMAIRREIERANFFNSLFGTWFVTGYDNVAICSNSHPLTGTTWAGSDSAVTGDIAGSRTTGTHDNLMTGDLGYSLIKDMITNLKRTPDEAGDFIQMTPKRIIISPKASWDAHELIDSKMPVKVPTDTSAVHQDAGEGHVNMVSRLGLEVVESPHILDDDATIMQCDYHDTQWFDRMKMQTNQEDDFATGDTLYKATERYGLGIGDWRGYVGSQGS